MQYEFNAGCSKGGICVHSCYTCRILQANGTPCSPSGRFYFPMGPGIKGNVLDVEGIDVVDGTPLLDIKPFVPGFRASGDIRIGWLKDKNERVTW